jgi:hypothetical protein
MFESHSWVGVLNTTLGDKVCQRFVADWWFSPCTPVSFTNNTDCHNIAEILLKVAFNTISLTLKAIIFFLSLEVFCFYFFLGGKVHQFIITLIIKLYEGQHFSHI